MVGDLDLSNNSLTNVGKLVMGGLITSYDVVPNQDGLYSLGNSTNWFDKIYVNTFYASDINSDNADITILTFDGN